MNVRMIGVGLALIIPVVAPASGEQLYKGNNWPALASDTRARGIGDTVTVLIHEAARASSKLQNNSGRATEFGGRFGAGSIDESMTLDFGGSYSGKGEVVRTEQFVAQMSATVTGLASNGDFLIEGGQQMLVNGETTTISLRGQVRPQDITAENLILSSRIANAEINYDGKGFVSRSAKPGLINRILNFLGIG